MIVKVINGNIQQVGDIQFSNNFEGEREFKKPIFLKFKKEPEPVETREVETRENVLNNLSTEELRELLLLRVGDENAEEISEELNIQLNIISFDGNVINFENSATFSYDLTVDGVSKKATLLRWSLDGEEISTRKIVKIDSSNIEENSSKILKLDILIDDLNLSRTLKIFHVQKNELNNEDVDGGGNDVDDEENEDGQTPIFPYARARVNVITELQDRV